MTEFFTELKALRESQNIDLEEIQSRTKINIEYLRAIENGQIDILPTPYVRLFLKAYVTEIGGDPDEAIHQLEIFQGKKTRRSVKREEVTQSPEAKVSESSSKSPTPSRPPTKVRQELIKGGVLLIIFLFAIYIIRKINEEKSLATVENGEIVLAQDPNAISEDQLINDYVEAVSQTVAMDVEPPLKLKLVTTERIWYSLSVDTSAAQTGILPAGNEKSMSFSDEIHVRLNQTSGTTMYINGIQVQELGEFYNPAVVHFYSDPRTVTVKHYIPQR